MKSSAPPPTFRLIRDIPVDERRAMAAGRPKCAACGGNAGTLIDGMHALCRCRHARQAATPSLGDCCPTCLGVGSLPKSHVGPLNPNQRAIEAWAPTCTECGGKGAINIADRMARPRPSVRP